MRVVRLIRLVKLFRHWGGQRALTAKSGRRSRLSRFGPPVKQSHVGQKLSELTTRRVVLGVLTMVLILPFLDIANTLYGTAPRFSEEGLRTLHSLALQDASSPLFATSLQVRAARRVFLTCLRPANRVARPAGGVTHPAPRTRGAAAL